MDDLIRRQDAIEAIKKCGEPFVQIFTNDFYVAVKAVERVPSAQPDKRGVEMNDLISRQAAIDAFNEWLDKTFNTDFIKARGSAKWLDSLPTLRCEDERRD